MDEILMVGESREGFPETSDEMMRPAYLCCPVCGFFCTHLKACEVNQLGSITTVTAEGTKLALGTPSGRGTRITINCTCEEGHRFQIALQFHKGSILVSTARGEDVLHDPLTGVVMDEEDDLLRD